MSGCIPITLQKGEVYKENSRGPRTEPCGTSEQHLTQFREGLPNFNCLETVAEIGREPPKGYAAHIKP